MKDAPRKVLVTGGAGFIASHVADAYVARGDRVWVVDDLSSGRRTNVPAQAEFVQMDVADPALHDLFRDVRFDLVNHHAAQIDVRRSVADPKFDASVNVLGLLNLLEAALETGVGRVLYISSGGVVYGEAETMPTPETSAKKPVSPYGVGKLTGEHYLYYYRTVHGLPYAALRYANVYGPRQDPHGEAGVVAIFSGRIARGEPLTVFGDGLQTRDYVFVKDVAEANVLLTRADLPEDGALDEVAYNVGTGRETNVLELADALMDVAGRQVKVAHDPARPGELERSVLDAGRLEEIGWGGGRALEEGLAQTYAALAEEGS